MSWLQRLTETYDACFGQPQFERRPLAPIDHVEQQAHIEVTLDEDGQFLRANVVPKEPTLIPATEKSAGRTSGVVAHPLCDKLRYVAELEPGSPEHKAYRDQLEQWAAFSPATTKITAILRYVQSGTVLQDLLSAGVLTADLDGGLEAKWTNGLSPLAKLLTADAKTKERDQGSALIRWRVEVADTLETAVWTDAALQREWAAFNATLGDKRGLCLNSGVQEPLAFNHPRRLRHGGDGAKLISANDASGYTYRGRFSAAEEAYGLGSASTQRAHNALRWLIDRQGNKHGDQVVVAWAIGGAPLPAPVVNTFDFFSEEGDDDDLLPPSQPSPPPAAAPVGDAGQAFARRLNKRIGGYRAKLGERESVVVLALDSATPGRMAILYYRELRGSEFLDRIER